MMFFDRANERAILAHVRKLLGTGSNDNTISGIKIRQIIEDPFFRVSSDSIFIQVADVIAFTLKEKEFPQASRKKYNADRIFQNKLSRISYFSSLADREGIIRT